MSSATTAVPAPSIPVCRWVNHPETSPRIFPGDRIAWDKTRQEVYFFRRMEPMTNSRNDDVIIGNVKYSNTFVDIAELIAALHGLALVRVGTSYELAFQFVVTD